MIEPCIPAKAKADFLLGVHQPGDTYMLALYTSEADLGMATASYTPFGEVDAKGYNPGGMELSAPRVTAAPTGGVMSFKSLKWTNASITARGAMVYNASKAGAVLAVLDFGKDITSTDGTFFLEMPEEGLIHFLENA